MKSHIERVKNSDDVYRYLKGFTKVYKQAFSRHPYYESFTDEEVERILLGLVHNFGGICCVMIEDDEVVGLAGGYSLIHENEIYNLVRESVSGIEQRRIFYLAELAVGDSYLQQGYGSRLVDARFALINRKEFDLVLHRTHIENNHSYGIYQRRGFERIPDVIQQCDTKTIDGGKIIPVKHSRIFSQFKL